MKLYAEHKFTFENEEYTVKIFETENGHSLQVFKGDERANNYTYCIDRIDAYDAFAVTNKSAQEHLIEQAQSDVENGFVFGKKL